MSTTPVPEYHMNLGDSLPDIPVWWPKDTGALWDFSSGWTLTARIGVVGQAALVTGITVAGAAGSGDGYGDDDVPNLTVSLTAAKAALLEIGGFQLLILATSGTRMMSRDVLLVVEPVTA